MKPKPPQRRRMPPCLFERRRQACITSTRLAGIIAARGENMSGQRAEVIARSCRHYHGRYKHGPYVLIRGGGVDRVAELGTQAFCSCIVVMESDQGAEVVVVPEQVWYEVEEENIPSSPLVFDRVEESYASEPEELEDQQERGRTRRRREKKGVSEGEQGTHTDMEIVRDFILPTEVETPPLSAENTPNEDNLKVEDFFGPQGELKDPE